MTSPDYPLSAATKSGPSTSACQCRSSVTSRRSSTLLGFRRATASIRSRAQSTPGSSLSRCAARWDRDPDFDANVAKLKSVRDAAAQRLKLDPGVLCARDRMEAVARRKPKSVEDLREVTELRHWQAEVLGPDFVAALKG